MLRFLCACAVVCAIPSAVWHSRGREVYGVADETRGLWDGARGGRDHPYSEASKRHGVAEERRGVTDDARGVRDEAHIVSYDPRNVRDEVRDDVDDARGVAGGASATRHASP